MGRHENRREGFAGYEGGAESPALWDRHHVTVRFGDLARRLARETEVLCSPPLESFDAEEIALEGRFMNLVLRPGLRLHVAEVEERHGLVTRSRHAPGLYCIFVLRGRLDLRFGNHALSLDAAGAGLTGVSVLHGGSESFERHAPAPQRLHKVIVHASPEWLEESRADLPEGLLAELELGGPCRWQVSKRLVQLVGEILRPAGLPPFAGLQLESRAIEIVTETLAAMAAPVDRQPESAGEATGFEAALDPVQQRQIERALGHIAGAGPSELSVASLARASGVSATVLQRLFQQAFGRSVGEHIRKLRLERAREALIAGARVAEASELAGYASAANFATAFRLHFGVSPRNLRRPAPGRG